MRHMFKRLSSLQKFIIRMTDYSDTVSRAFREFLAVPSLIIWLFLLTAIGAYLFERSSLRFSSPIMAFLSAHVFVDAQATSDLLGNIAGSIITVTSITITLLLLIVQQSAGNMTSQVFDQFLRRRSNQLYFGFFVGLAVYILITLATVDEPFNPVFAASLAFVLTVIALFLLIVLFYSTIHQMRPPVIIAAIHDHTLAARHKQKDLVQRTRRKPQLDQADDYLVRSTHHGFVTDINLRLLSGILDEIKSQAEVVVLVPIGGFVAFQDPIAEVRANELEDVESVADKVRQAIHLEQSRDLDRDPAYGIQQLEVIAWTVTSTAKSNLAPGLQAIFSLRDLMARWADDEQSEKADDLLPVVYNDDVVSVLIRSFGSLLIVAAESREHQIAIEVFVSFSSLFSRLPAAWQQQVEEMLLRLIPAYASFRLTSQLEESMQQMIQALRMSDDLKTADRLQEALIDLRQS
jgi:hypothetical protein